jgi:quercetin dioxygenase-like cupin family protein
LKEEAMGESIEEPGNPEGGQPVVKRRVRIAKASEARNLDTEVMPWVGVSAEDGESLLNLYRDGAAEGSVIKLIYEDSVSGMSLTYAWFKANYLLPPHSHNSDCTYYVISGEAHLGTEVLRAGDVFFVPSDTFYAYQAGPQGVEVLECRTSTKFNLRVRGLGKSFPERAMKIITENLPNWRRQEPPAAARRFLDPSL